ncbi:MAG: hypothetical protein Kow0059_01810 [Candidatus Sumerlaeia bacterium]
MTFQPDYRHMLEVMANRRPARLPLYEHIISPGVMEKILGVSFAAEHQSDDASDLGRFFSHFCRFYARMTYDTVSYEVCIIPQMPDHGAILGGRPGPIQSRSDLDRYPWEEIPERFWRHASPRFEALAAALPPGMKAVGGVGNGVLEIAEDLVGFEWLCAMLYEEPELAADLFVRIGDLMTAIWERFLERHAGAFAVCRFGDDLGFKTGTLISPAAIRDHIIPQYRRVIGLIRGRGYPFLWHSCGCIFAVMDDVIALGINAKHSNEDIIAPYEDWIRRYGERIGLVGGIDVDILCQHRPDEVFEIVRERGRRYRSLARGYALGSGNSIPDYVPVEGYLAMIRAAQALRAEDARS